MNYLKKKYGREQQGYGINKHKRFLYPRINIFYLKLASQEINKVIIQSQETKIPEKNQSGNS